MAPHTEVHQASADSDAPTQAMVERTLALAVEVFQDDANVIRWLKTPHPVWEVSPLLKMRTRAGLEAVEQDLHGLSHGIF